MRSDLGPFLFGALVGGLVLAWLLRQGVTDLDRLVGAGGGLAAGSGGPAVGGGSAVDAANAAPLAALVAAAVGGAGCGCAGGRRKTNEGSWWGAPSATQIPNTVPTN